VHITLVSREPEPFSIRGVLVSINRLSTAELKWLKIFRASCIFVFVTGLSPSFAVFESTEEPWRLFFDLLTWPLDGQPATFASTDRQLSAVLGGVLCGWALLLYQLARPEIFNSNIRRQMMLSIWVWFALDSAGSVIAQLPLNVVGNLGFLLSLIIPLHALRTVQS
jgi:hypothetical protein